jgi:6-pyruvoyltetrahydropterin/6-carboxytetrahydropterin synthase
MNKVYVTKRATFEAAHHLPEYDGKCAKIHGHSYKLEVTFSGRVDIRARGLATDAMVCDFHIMKSLIDRIINRYDHTDLNTYFAKPTAETLAVAIYNELLGVIPRDCELCSVKLWETEDSYAEYRGEV